jgi:protein-S-isoprenylcysteine O-methyltransferase Ste14
MHHNTVLLWRCFGFRCLDLAATCRNCFESLGNKKCRDNNWSVYPVPNKGSAISSLGAYRYVRHPMYTALLLFFMAVAIRANGPFSWAIYGILWIMLLTKVLVEEHKITQKHPEYTQYKRVTKKRLIPFVW